MYNIIGISQQGAEVIDTADNRIEAIKLVNEYKMAFGNEWIIKFKRK
jgi:YesN/AraC family two-component response regulator|tara:strand:- start:394 stop:534 length:141 start_codon:yes stop_codon:yes gene_type:complete